MSKAKERVQGYMPLLSLSLSPFPFYLSPSLLSTSTLLYRNTLSLSCLIGQYIACVWDDAKNAQGNGSRRTDRCSPNRHCNINRPISSCNSPFSPAPLLLPCYLPGHLETLIVLSEVDMITPCCTQLTYEGLIDELLNIQNGIHPLPPPPKY